MKHTRKIQKILFSTLGLILLFAILIIVNAIFARLSIRLDLTEDKLYTLSDGTKNILKKLDAPITFKFYRSRGENRMPVQLRSFSDRIRTLLEEYVKHSDGKIILEEFDPAPDSDAEDAANLDNITGQQLPTGEKLYLGLSVNYLDKTVSIPFFSPHEEPLFEYLITSAIAEALTGDAKKKIGLITDLPVLGGFSPQTFMRRGAEKIPWIFAGELKKRFELVNLNNTEKIPDDINALVIIHPKNLQEKTLFAIDQFLMRGGRLLIALDPYCIIESRTSIDAMMGNSPPPGSSNLEKFLSNWNLQFSQNQIVADLNLAMRNINAPEADIYPTILDIRDLSRNNKDNPALSNINHINMVYAGAFTGSPPEYLQLTKILTASDNSTFIESFMAEFPPSQILRDFKKDLKEKILIAKLSGKFKTAFPDGLKESSSSENKNNNPNTDQEKKEESTQNLLKESPETFVILIADVDMFADEFSVQKQKFLGTTLIQPFNENLVFLQNIIEQLAGDSDLLKIRSKRIKERPFTKIIALQTEAQNKFQQELNTLEKKREEVESKINELQRGKPSGKQQFILSKEQLEEIERYRKEEALTRKKIKELRKQLRADIEKLQFKIQAINAATIPAALVIIGISIWLTSRKRRAK